MDTVDRSPSHQDPAGLGCTLATDTIIRPNREVPSSIHRIRLVDEALYTDLVNSFDGCVDGYLSKFIRANEGSARRYISDVVSVKSDECRNYLLERFPLWAGLHRGK